MYSGVYSSSPVILNYCELIVSPFFSGMAQLWHLKQFQKKDVKYVLKE